MPAMPSMPSSARSGAGLRGGGADRHDRGPARVSALCGADLSPRLVLRAVGEPGAGLGAVAGVVGGGAAQAGLGAGRGVGYRQRPTRTRDLEPFIGSPGKVAAVMKRQLPLSLEMIRHLAAGLHLPAEVLIQEYALHQDAA